MDRRDDPFAPLLPPELARLPEWRELVRLGVDTALLRDALAMTPTQRLEELIERDALYVELHGIALSG